MTSGLEELKSELMALPPESRAWLARELIESLDAAIDADAESAWLEEARGRAGEIDNGTVVCIPAAEVLERIRVRLQCLK